MVVISSPGLPEYLPDVLTIGQLRALLAARIGKPLEDRRDVAVIAGETLTSEQVHRRAFSKRRLFFTRLAFKSAKARRGKARARRGLLPMEKVAPDVQHPGTAKEFRRDRAERSPAA